MKGKAVAGKCNTVVLFLIFRREKLMCFHLWMRCCHGKLSTLKSWSPCTGTLWSQTTPLELHLNSTNQHEQIAGVLKSAIIHHPVSCAGESLYW